MTRPTKIVVTIGRGSRPSPLRPDGRQRPKIGIKEIAVLKCPGCGTRGSSCDAHDLALRPSAMP